MKKIGMLISTFFLVSLFALTFSTIVQYEPTAEQMNPESRVRIFESPINIYNNDDLNSTSSSGNGTAGFPWIIENKSIDIGGASDEGILISGTTDYFILRNCTILNGGSSSDGIKLLGVINGIIRNNTIKNSSTGINIQNCLAVQLSDNIIQNITQGPGIYLVRSNDTLISDNKISNTKHGMYIYQTRNNRLFHNVITETNNNGIYLATTQNSNNYTISYNTITNCDVGIP
jgi:parallel beta-helix repeat protein